MFTLQNKKIQKEIENYLEEILYPRKEALKNRLI